jgi:hypothetical protein
MKPMSVLTLAATALMAISTALADPTQGDFGACNWMAQSSVDSPSASPSHGQPQLGATTRSGTAMPQAATSPEATGEARISNQADQFRGSPGTSTDDPAYQQAYRNCMTRWGL